MMRSRSLVLLSLLTPVALLCATCAPVEPTRPGDNPTPANGGVSAPRPLQPSDMPAGDSLRTRIELAIDQVRRRDLLTTNGFWTIFHGILGLGPSITLKKPDSAERVNAVEWICDGGEVRGLRFIPTNHGLDVETGELFVSQGHQDQFIAEMAQWGMPADRKFRVLGREYTFLDFVRHSQMRARVTATQELSWTILVVGQYLGTDISWANSHGEKLHFEDLVRYELNQPMDPAACGGTHRLFGLSWVYHLHLQKGGTKTGVWSDVADFLERHKLLARRYQNPDGSFSTSFFRDRGNLTDMQLRMNTTGHTLEWLALALTDAELRQPWVREAASRLALMFLEIKASPMEGGTLYHAIHGLLIYYARVYGREKLGANDPYLVLPPPVTR